MKSKLLSDEHDWLFEIQSSDVDREMYFYQSVFGRKFTRNDAVPIKYYTIETKGIRGGLLERPSKIPPPESGTNAFTCSVEVENFDETRDKIIVHGGKIALPKLALTGVCKQGYFIDPDNNVFGIFEANTSAK